MNRLPRYREKSKEFVQRKLLEKVPETILWQQACEELFQRDYNTINDEIRRFRSGRNGSAKKIR